MLGVGQDVAVVAGVLTAFSCSLVFKEEFSLLSSSFSAAGVTASVTSTASNPSIGSHRVEFKVLLPPSSEEILFCCSNVPNDVHMVKIEEASGPFGHL